MGASIAGDRSGGGRRKGEGCSRQRRVDDVRAAESPEAGQYYSDRRVSAAVLPPPKSLYSHIHVDAF